MLGYAVTTDRAIPCARLSGFSSASVYPTVTLCLLWSQCRCGFWQQARCAQDETIEDTNTILTIQLSVSTIAAMLFQCFALLRLTLKLFSNVVKTRPTAEQPCHWSDFVSLLTAHACASREPCAKVRRCSHWTHCFVRHDIDQAAPKTVRRKGSPQYPRSASFLPSIQDAMDIVRAPTPAGASDGPRKSLEDAIDDFQTILTDDQRRKLRSIGAMRDAETVMIFAAHLDQENQLKKGRGIATRLHSVLQSVQTFSTVVDAFVSSRPEIAALVWGSIKLAMLVSDACVVLHAIWG